ncbi:tyrosine-protein phosphatase siw14, partial [Chytridiales sp. JEL 0842]
YQSALSTTFLAKLQESTPRKRMDSLRVKTDGTTPTPQRPKSAGHSPSPHPIITNFSPSSSSSSQNTPHPDSGNPPSSASTQHSASNTRASSTHRLSRPGSAAPHDSVSTNGGGPTSTSAGLYRESVSSSNNTPSGGPTTSGLLGSMAFLRNESQISDVLAVSGGDQDGLMEELIPCENFNMICKGVYRSAFPKKKNFAFLKKLGLRSI